MDGWTALLLLLLIRNGEEEGHPVGRLFIVEFCLRFGKVRQEVSQE